MALKIFIYILLIASINHSNASPNVTISNGEVTLIGETIIELSVPRQIHRFIGIPYAEPPIGKLRFRRPLAWKPKQPDTTIIHATEWPNSCVQSNENILVQNANVEYKALGREYSEDCLYLNVWTPQIGIEKLRPVLVWIHGGGLIFDSSTIEIYNGQTLASRADAVVVSMNYRLSTIGFMYSDQVPEIRGNQGLWDQTLALKWVQENIHNFGGNPNQVTIVGESAGAWSVSAHILSPISRDLFQDAILMSGSALFKTVQYPEKMVERLLKGIRKVGCANEQDLSIDQKVVDCLEKLDAKLVDQIAYAMNNNSMDFPGIVTVDGEFLPEHPLKMLKSGNHKKNFNILFDTVEDEGSFLLYFSQNEPKFLRENPKPITLNEAKQYLLDLLADKILYTQKLPNKTITSVYFSGLNANFDAQDSFRRQVGIAYGDLMLACPTIEFARQIFESSPDTVQVYQWYYSAKVGDKLKWSCSKWSGTCHGNDLNPLFGSPFRHPEKYHNRERDISNEVINFVKKFLRTGKLGRDQQEWQSYFMENGKPIAPYYEIGDSAKSFESFKFNLKQLECDQIWGRFINDLKY